MGDRVFTPGELRYWRVYAAIQELAHASDEDMAAAPDFRKLVDISTRAIIAEQDRRRETLVARTRAGILEEVGVPVLRPKR